MTDRLFVADARTVSGAEFYRAVFGTPSISREEQSERSVAYREYCDAMMVRHADYWLRRDHDNACRARYSARLQEIAAKYQLTETQSDPLLRRKRA